MNGDSQIIFNKLEAMEAKQDKRHEDNLKTFGNLQCDRHDERMNGLKGDITWMWAIMSVMLSGCIYGFWFLIRN